MNNKSVIIQGSAKSDGNTNKIANYITDKIHSELIDLHTKDIGYFDYDFVNSGDDFIPLMKRVSERFDTIIFATPVYWYSMSGIMKVFFDRITDLLQKEKEIGKKLRGKNMAMVSCGSDSNLQSGFTMPFVETAGYLGMNYLGSAHCWVESNEIPQPVIETLEEFIAKVK